MRPRRNNAIRPGSSAGLVLAAVLLWPASGRGLAGEFAATVRTATDGTLTGRLIAFSLEEGLVLQAGAADDLRRFPVADIVELATDYPAVTPGPGLVTVELAHGDRLIGRVTGGGDDSVALETRSLGTVSVPLDRILLWKAPVSVARDDSSAFEAFAEARGDDDAVLLANGDVVRGLIASIDSSGFAVETDAGGSLIPHDSVVVAAMLPLGPPPLDGVVAKIVTTDGQRLTASRLEWSGTSASAAVLGDVILRIPAERVARVAVLGGRWEWLTALEPISFQHTPALSLPWEWAVDRNAAGGPIRVAGQQFEHGLGVHSESSITFDLRGDYAEFTTSMGLDDDSGPYANVDVEIRVDGQLRFDQQAITPGRLYGPIRLDVTGARRIKLTVLFGANADIQDRFDWVEAALIR
jgi:hypothetical protein